MFSLSAVAHSPSVQSIYDLVLGFGSHYRGIYPTMERAREKAPGSRRFGYDHPQAAELYKKHLELRWGDYALLFWLGRIFANAHTVFDIGGNIGVSYYAFEKYLSYPPGLQWVVYDLPASVAAGERFLKNNPRPGLRFTTNLEECKDAEIVLAAGALQYIDWSFPDWLGNLARPPKHVLINKLPTYDGPTFVTLQDIGPTVCAYRVFSHREFVASMAKLGYALADHWTIGDLQCRIAFHPSRTVTAYSGMYFTLA